MTYIGDRLDGFELRSLPSDDPATKPRTKSSAEAEDFPKYYQQHWLYAVGAASLRAHGCTGPISYRAIGELDRDIANFKRAAAGLEVADLFLSAISPAMVWTTQNEYYPDDDTYRHAICDALAEEYAHITAAGIVLQIDCPDLGFPPRVSAGLHLDD